LSHKSSQREYYTQSKNPNVEGKVHELFVTVKETLLVYEDIHEEEKEINGHRLDAMIKKTRWRVKTSGTVASQSQGWERLHKDCIHNQSWAVFRNALQGRDT